MHSILTNVHIKADAAVAETRAPIQAVRRTADTRSVEQQPPTWTFMRGTDRLQISREDVDDGVMLTVAGDGAPRSYFFREHARLEIFQRDMETLLLKTGWSFIEYAPEKRRGRDRRGWPRKSDDRRRWWTDGARLPRQPKAKSTELPPARTLPIAPRVDSQKNSK